MAWVGFASLSLRGTAQCPETENNNTPGTADSISLTCMANGTMDQPDGADYFLFDLEGEGRCTLSVNKTGSGEILVRILDAYRSGQPEVRNVYLASAINHNQLIVGLLPGKYYIKVEWYNGGACQYTLGLGLSPSAWGQDLEPNHPFQQAGGIRTDTLFGGSLGYSQAGSGEDPEDWYRFEVEETGLFNMRIVKAGSGEIQIKLLEDPSNTAVWIKDKYLTQNENSDSLIHPLRKGRYYLQLARVGFNLDADYQISIGLIPLGIKDDEEHNNQAIQATTIGLDTAITGSLGFYSPGSGLETDNRDWYRIRVNKPGLLLLKQKTSVTAGYRMTIWAGDGVQPLIFIDVSPGMSGDSSAYLFRDTGTYFLSLEPWSGGYGYYEINVSFLPYPVAAFDYTQLDNKISFHQQSLHARTYHWEFGDSASSTAAEPIHNYSDPGVFEACLIIRNAATSDTICKPITVKGIASVYPRSAGNTGDLTLSVYGGGMDEKSILRLRKGGALIAEQTNTRRFALDGISGTLDLRGKATGLYDVEVENGDGGIFSLKDALEIVPGTFPDPWVEVTGRNRILFNTPSTYKIRYGNNGNVDATMVPVWIAISEVPGLEVNFTGTQFIELNEAGDSLTADLSDTDEYLIMDTVLGKPFKARVYPFLIPVVGANSSEEFNIRIKAGADIRIQAWTNMPFFQSPLDSTVTKCIRNVSIHVLAPLLGLLPFETFGNCIIDEFNRTIKELQRYYSILGGFANDKIRAEFELTPKNFIKHLKFIKRLVNECVLKEYGMGNYESTQGWRTRMAEGITMALINLMTLPPEQIIDCLKGNCSKTNALRSKPGECRECATFCAINERQTQVRVVSSLDPNEKEGPSGYSNANHHSFQKSIPFTIHFENMASASAPAHRVVVIDTLDKEVFDLGSFQFGTFSIADSVYQPDKGQFRFFADVPLHQLNVVARIEAALDTVSGRLEWTFSSREPGTLLEVEDPDIGFLPPNKIKPEGQGSVSFTIDLREDLPHGSVIQNKALIYFDANAPIETNIYRITLDLIAPESQVQALNPMPIGNKIEVNWSGTDQGSGIAYYDVFVSDNDSLYQRWKIRTTSQSDTFVGRIGHHYKFYSTAVDFTGNAETSPGMADASTAITTPARDMPLEEGWQIYPNPAGDFIQVIAPTSNFYSLLIENMQGQILLQIPIREAKSRLSMDRLDSGLYMVQVMNEKHQLVHRSKLVVL